MKSELEDYKESIAHHSKSFALASRLLPPLLGERATVLYAWCRRADDAIDLEQTEAPAVILRRLRRELQGIYAGEEPSDAVLRAFGRLLRETGIPERYPTELLEGLEMDVRGQAYETLDDLLLYCYRVASTVGLMMCHVMGVSHPAALRPAAHLGLAMQLTNICRDVAEDWQRGRLYLPRELLARHRVGWLAAHATPAQRRRGEPFPPAAVDGCRAALAELLVAAERYYVSSDAGLEYLSARSALAVNAARRIYSAIGGEIARHDYDVCAPRAVVPRHRKVAACGAAAAAQMVRGLARSGRRFAAVPLETVEYGSELIAL
jgi:phytoene synthase